MKEIPLTQGKIALVDDADYEWLSKWKWYYAKDRKTGYAQHMEGKRPNRKVIKMHRLIMQTSLGMDVDHTDFDGCNNQRYNLRNCTNTQNQMNAGMRRTNKSGYKGVYWFKLNCTWVAQIRVKGKKLYLGSFDNPKDAARAYDKAAIQYFGEFAHLNFK